jgi:hypothetical protein
MDRRLNAAQDRSSGTAGYSGGQKMKTMWAARPSEACIFLHDEVRCIYGLLDIPVAA